MRYGNWTVTNGWATYRNAAEIGGALDINLDHFKTPQDVTANLAHLLDTKDWMSAEDIGNFVTLLNHHTRNVPWYPA